MRNQGAGRRGDSPYGESPALRLRGFSAATPGLAVLDCSLNGVDALSYTGLHAGNSYTASRTGAPPATGSFTGPRAGADCRRGADRDGPTPGSPLGEDFRRRRFSCLAPELRQGVEPVPDLANETFRREAIYQDHD